MLKPPGTNLLTLKYDEPLASFALQYNLRRYTPAFFEQPEEVVKALQTFGVALYAPIVERLGWDARPGDDYQTVRLRQLAISRSLALEDPAAAAEAGAYTRPLLSST